MSSFFYNSQLLWLLIYLIRQILNENIGFPMLAIAAILNISHQIKTKDFMIRIAEFLSNHPIGSVVQENSG